jgi:hypothetical protein
MVGMETGEMIDAGKVVDLASYRARKNREDAKPRRDLADLRLRQRETIEKLRALGYEMSLPRRD